MNSGIRRRTLVAAVGGIAMSMCLDGCMLSNPYVKTPTVDDVPRGCGDQCSIGAAQQYSRSVRGAYRERLGRYAVLRNDSGAAEILLGATALGLAAGKANRDAFVTAGLAGATTYALATWFGNSDLEALYASAIRALTCAETAVEPLRLSDIEIRELDEGMTSIREGLPALGSSLARLDGLIDAVKAYSGSTASTLLIARAQGASDSAHTTATKAANAYGSSASLRHLNAVAGNELARTVERIVAAVDDETRKTQPDLSAALTIAGGLGTLSAKIAPGLDAVLQEAMQKSLQKPTKELQGRRKNVGMPPRELSDAVEQAIRDVSVDVSKVSAAITELDAIVSHVQTNDAGPVLAACNITLTAALTMVPSSLSILHGARTATFVVSGGKPPYLGKVLGVAPAGLSVVNPTPGDRTFELTTTADTADGNYVLSIYDSTSRSVALPVEIKPESPGSAQDNSKSPKPATSPPGDAPTMDATLADLKAKLVGQVVAGTFKVIKVETAGNTFTVTTDPAAADDVDKSKIRQAVLNTPLADGDVNKRVTALQASLKINP